MYATETDREDKAGNEVNNRLADLELIVDQLAERHVHLADRLSPVLRSNHRMTGAIGEDKPKAIPISSPIAQRIEVLQSKVATIISSVQENIDRLDI